MFPKQSYAPSKHHSVNTGCKRVYRFYSVYLNDDNRICIVRAPILSEGNKLVLFLGSFKTQKHNNEITLRCITCTLCIIL
jgi:hypothetical protein